MTEKVKETKGGRVVVLTIVGLLVLVGAGYAGAYAGAGAKVPRGATVAGVKIGGMDADAAVDKLEAEFGGREQIKVSVAGQQTTVSVADLGLALDAEATVAEAGGERSWAPGRLWDYYTGGDDVDPVVTLDDASLETALAELDEKYGEPATDGRVFFRKGDVRTTEAKIGKGVDRAAAKSALTDAFLGGGVADVSLTDLDPAIDAGDVRTALDEFANPAVSGAVTLLFEEARIQLTPREFGASLSLEAVDGTLEPKLNAKKLEKLVRSKVADHDGAPVDATVKLVNGKPKVVPSKPGVDFAPDDITSTFLDLVIKPAGEREAEVEATVQQPEFTTKDAEALGIVEEVSSFTTYYPAATYRNVNIGRAAELVNGTVLKPGETFSLNETVGERTAANGFTAGTIISNGVFKTDLGGGVSQMATTLFNAMFFAGLEDIEHKPHSVYINRYPVGREATVAWGSVDLRFRNDTDYGVLISANVTPGSGAQQGVVTVKMYSTKVWDITTTASERYNYRSPTTRYITTAGCEPYSSPTSGFDIDVKRHFHKPGSKKIEKTENFHTAYIAGDRVVCGPPPGANKNDDNADNADD